MKFSYVMEVVMAHTGNPVGRIRDVALFYGVCTKTITRWIEAGKLPVLKMSPHSDWLFDMEEVRADFKRRCASRVKRNDDRQAA